MIKRVLCCGDRDWTDREKIRSRLAMLPRDTVIVHGNARGADKIAGEIATELGFRVEPFPADWLKYRLAAGPIRNIKMLNTLTRNDLVLAFHSNIERSKGTKHCVINALSRSIPTEVIQ